MIGTFYDWPLYKSISQLEENLCASLYEILKDKFNFLSYKDFTFIYSPYIHYITHALAAHIHLIEIKSENKTGINFEEFTPGDSYAIYRFTQHADFPNIIKNIFNRSILKNIYYDTEQSSINIKNKYFYAKVLSYKSGFKRNFRLKLRLHSLFKIVFINSKEKREVVAPNHFNRSNLKTLLKNKLFQKNIPFHDEWATILITLLPKSLYEMLEANYYSAKNHSYIKKMFSCNAWIFEDKWKITALYCKKNFGTLLIGSPHSVAYGALESFWLRKFEINHLDLYLTWGWKSDCSNVIDFYWPNNSGRKEEFNYNNSNEQRKKILLTTAARPKHTLEYPYHVSIYEKYLQEQIELIKRINSDLSHKVYVRTRDKTTGWGIVNLYAKSQLNVTVEKQSGSFTRILNNFEIHISDNCSTAYLESIAANWPTLIVNSSSYFIFSDQGNEYYFGLKQVGIYHESIDSLINHLRSINNNIKGWWFSEEVQKSINTFMYTQGRHTQSTTEWLEKLL